MGFNAQPTSIAGPVRVIPEEALTVPSNSRSHRVIVIVVVVVALIAAVAIAVIIIIITTDISGAPSQMSPKAVTKMH